MSSDAARKLRILVVEDSATQRRHMEDLFTRAGLLVEAVEDGETGRDRALAEAWDAIVSDVVLPGLSGFDLCRAVKETPEKQGTPVLLVSGMNDSTNFMRSVRSGADAYLPKTTGPERLVAALEELLEQRKNHRGGNGSGPSGGEAA